MGDAEKADLALVPDIHWMDDDEWAVAEGYHHVDANYRLLVDNLLDLSRETFVHPETIGNGAVADSPVSVGIIDKKIVRAHRDMLGCEPPPQFVALASFTGRIDRWHTRSILRPDAASSKSARGRQAAPTMMPGSRRGSSTSSPPKAVVPATISGRTPAISAATNRR